MNQVSLNVYFAAPNVPAVRLMCENKSAIYDLAILADGTERKYVNCAEVHSLPHRSGTVKRLEEAYSLLKPKLVALLDASCAQDRTTMNALCWEIKAQLKN